MQWESCGTRMGSWFHITETYLCGNDQISTRLWEHSVRVSRTTLAVLDVRECGGSQNITVCVLQVEAGETPLWLRRSQMAGYWILDQFKKSEGWSPLKEGSGSELGEGEDTEGGVWGGRGMSVRVLGVLTIEALGSWSPVSDVPSALWLWDLIHLSFVIL